MKIELLIFEGCPNAEPARALLLDCMASLGVAADITEVRVETQSEAERLAFPGSPTLRVDGEDVASTGPVEGSLACRTYRVGNRIQGLPDRAWVLGALRKAMASETQDGQGTLTPSTGNRRTALAGVALGLLASACCWIPFALAGMGIAGGAVTARIAWLRPWALGGLALSLVGVAGVWVYRRLRPSGSGDCCAHPPQFPALPLLILVLSILGAWQAPRMLDTAPAAAPVCTPGAFLVISTPQYDCPPCAGTLPQTMARTPGVASVQMDFDKRETRIAFKEGAHVDEILAGWKQDLGFSGRVLQR